MGKTLLRAQRRRSTPRHVLPCKRSCSCCSEDSLKTSLLKSKTSRQKQHKKRGKGLVKNIKRLVTFKNNLKSLRRRSHYRSVQVEVKPVTVNVIRLSQKVLDELSVKGSVRVSTVGIEGGCNLSSRRNACLVSPSRRLRSTPVYPFVRQNVMDKLRGLNADWRSTTYPTAVCHPPGSTGPEHAQEFQLRMKTLFLENLSICKKSSTIKEDVTMSQDENRANLINQPRVVTKPMPSVMYMPYSDLGGAPRPPWTFQSKMVPINGKMKPCHSLLAERIQQRPPLPVVPGNRQNVRSLLSKTTLTRPALSSKKTIVTVPRVPQEPDPLALGKTVEAPPEASAPLKFTPLPQALFSRKTTPTGGPQNIPKPSSHQKFNPMPKILEAGSRKTRNIETSRSIETNFLTNMLSTSKQKLSTLNRRKQLMSAQPSRFNSHLVQPSPLITLGAAASCHNPSGPYKKQRIDLQTPDASIPQWRHHRPNLLQSLKPQETAERNLDNSSVLTIVLSDSDDEHIKKGSPAKPYVHPQVHAPKPNTPLKKIAQKRTPATDSRKRKTASKTTPGSQNGKNRPNVNLAKTPVRKVPTRRKNVRKVSRLSRSSSDSEEFSSDSEVEAPKYVSRTGRSIAVSSGCRSCPGCKIDERKGKSAPKGGSKKSKIELKTKQSVRVIPNELPSRKPGSPISVIVQGLTSSDSDDDLTQEDIRRVLKQVKWSQVVASGHKNRAEVTASSLQSYSTAPAESSNLLIANGGSSGAPIPAQPELHESAHPSTDVDLITAVGLESQAHSAQNTPNVQCYVSSHYDSNGALLLDEDDISSEYTESKRQPPNGQIVEIHDQTNVEENKGANCPESEQYLAVVNTGTDSICVSPAKLVGSSGVISNTSSEHVTGLANCDDESSCSNCHELPSPSKLEVCHQNNVTSPQTTLGDNAAANAKKCLEAGSEQNDTNASNETLNCSVQPSLDICEDSQHASNRLPCTTEFQEISLVSEDVSNLPPKIHDESSLPDMTATTILSSEQDCESLIIADQTPQGDNNIHDKGSSDGTPEAAEDCRSPSHKYFESYDDPQAIGTVLQNDISKLVTAHDCKMSGGPMEILILEGCPSCQSNSKPDEISCQDGGDKGVNTPLAQLSASSRPLGSSCGADSKAQEGFFYTAMSDLLIQCLNNVVQEVKLNNREVIIKKVDKSSGNASDMDTEQAGFAAEDLASIAHELNLPVSLNPRLTIKKLPFTPRECHTYETKSENSQDTSVDEVCESLMKTPTKTLYERKGFPTPIKRLNPRVLTVIKYNDLEIYNDEPSLNDPPESDRLVCVSSKGVRIELNAEELANIENVLNDFHDKSYGEAAESFEIDDLVIYNDEPPLNPVSGKRVRCPLFECGEDLEDLVIDNDDPPLNEDSEVDHNVDGTECMVISSDDEVVVDSGKATEVVSMPVVRSVSANPGWKPKRKLFRKKRISCKSVKAPVSELLRSQMECTAGSVEDSTSPVCPMDDIYEQVVDVLATPPSWNAPSSVSYGEVLYQPQVFNLQGQPLLFDAPIPQPSIDPLALPSQSLDLTQPYTESVNISDSDTLTGSECGDEVEVISSPEKFNSSAPRRAFSYGNGCDTLGVVQTVDSDSDSDVVVLKGPNNLPTVDHQLRTYPIPVIPSAVPIGNVRIAQQHGRPHTLAPTQVTSVCTANGEQYYVLVVPPNTHPSNNILGFPR